MALVLIYMVSFQCLEATGLLTPSSCVCTLSHTHTVHSVGLLIWGQVLHCLLFWCVQLVTSTLVQFAEQSNYGFHLPSKPGSMQGEETRDAYKSQALSLSKSKQYILSETTNMTQNTVKA